MGLGIHLAFVSTKMPRLRRCVRSNVKGVASRVIGSTEWAGRRRREESLTILDWLESRDLVSYMEGAVG